MRLILVFGLLTIGLMSDTNLHAKIKITTLIENTKIDKPKSLKAEHGVSLHIDYRDQQILFDTGRTDQFVKNAKLLNIDLKSVDYVVISHAHMDHGGGLNHFLAINKKAKIYLHENCKHDYFYKDHEIGLSEELFSKNKDRFIFVNGDTKIASGISLVTKFVQKHHRPKNENLFIKRHNQKVLDDFAHEIALVLENNKELIVFTGCSHNGILNMVDAALEKNPKKTIRAVVGGFHLTNPVTRQMSESKNTVMQIAHAINKLPVKTIYTGHCTGSDAYSVLKSVLNRKLHMFKTGSSIVF